MRQDNGNLRQGAKVLAPGSFLGKMPRKTGSIDIFSSCKNPSPSEVHLPRMTLLW